MKLRLSNSLQRVRAPILILHGVSDSGTPFRVAQILMEELAFAGKSDVWFRAYDGGHSPPPEEIRKALDWALGILGN